MGDREDYAIECVHKFRTAKGDTWGGPPYSEEEYKVIRQAVSDFYVLRPYPAINPLDEGVR